MIDIDGTTHAIATTAEASNIGLSSAPSVTYTGTLRIEDTRTTGINIGGLPNTVSHSLIQRLYLGPINSNINSNILLTLRGGWHAEDREGAVVTKSGLNCVTYNVNYGITDSTGSTAFSGPNWTISTLDNDTPEIKSYTFGMGSNKYIMIEWNSDGYLNIPDSGLVDINNLYSSVMYIVIEATVSLQSTIPSGNNKCITKAELSTYNCLLKTPVPSEIAYPNNQCVLWYDIEAILH